MLCSGAQQCRQIRRSMALGWGEVNTWKLKHTYYISPESYTSNSYSVPSTMKKLSNNVRAENLVISGFFYPLPRGDYIASKGGHLSDEDESSLK